MKFDDDKYVEEYYHTGRFPKIHDDIFTLAALLPGRNVLDLGCCKGLLSKRLSTVCNLVVGIDGSKSYLDKAVPDSKVKYYCTKVVKETLPFIVSLIKKHDISMIVARRVIPELCETGGMQLVNDFVKSVYDSGVEYIVLEGRKKCHNPTNPLSSIDLEVKAFSSMYSVVNTHKDCRTLKRK